MTSLLITQIIVDFVLAVVLTVLFREYRRQKAHSAREQLSTECFKEIESRASALEQHFTDYRQRMNAQLLILAEICKEAKNVLARGQTHLSAYSPSLEERELRQLTGHAGGLDKIPTLQDLERTNERLKSDMALDLKTLLRDQLA